MLEVILKQEVRKLGDRGDVVSVAPGYARNYLYPRDLAIPATAANKKQIEQMQAAAAREAEKLTSDAQQLAGKMDGLTVRIVARAGDSNQLFGSVTTRDIAAAMAEKGFEIDRHKIILEHPLKEVGDFDIRVHLYRKVKTVVKVEVRAEGRENEPLVAAVAEEEEAPEAMVEATPAAEAASDEPSEAEILEEELEAGS